LQLTDASSAELLQAMNAQAKRLPKWTMLAIMGGAGLFVGHFAAMERGWFVSYIPQATAAMLVVCAAFIGAGIWYDKVCRLTVLFYDLDKTSERAYESFCNAIASIGKVSRLWAVSESVKYADTKYHAGAHSGVKRSGASMVFRAPPSVRCNIPVPVLTSGPTRLALFPDRALVFQGRRVGAVPYSQLVADVARSEFREEESLPHDTNVLGHTWKYVNKKGGPDRRFKNNRQVPICDYSSLRLRSATGLSMYFLASKPRAFDVVPPAVRLLAVLEKSSAVEVAHRAA